MSGTFAEDGHSTITEDWPVFFFRTTKTGFLRPDVQVREPQRMFLQFKVISTKKNKTINNVMWTIESIYLLQYVCAVHIKYLKANRLQNFG
jgi:hypothetical protein